MNALMQWASSQKKWVHTLAGLAVAAGVLWATDKQFHDIAMHLWSGLPGKVQEVITLGAILGAFYAKTQKDVTPQQPNAPAPPTVKP